MNLEELRKAIAAADNASAAAKVLGDHAARGRPEYDGQAAAFQHAGRVALEPFFGDAAKGVSEAVCETAWRLARRNGNPIRSEPRSTDRPLELPRVRTLGQILADPEALNPPTPVAPHLAWPERVSMLAAREKVGKGTLVAGAVAAVSNGLTFLDGRAMHGFVLYAALEDHTADLARRLHSFAADPDRTLIPDPIDTHEQLAGLVSDYSPLLVVVDTLAKFVERLELESGDGSGWTRAMTPFIDLARETGAAVLLVHHGGKADGSYRDSTAIGASVDVILEMRPDGEDAYVRHVRAKGRVPVRDYRVKYHPAPGGPAYFELLGAELSLDARILRFVEDNPGSSQRAIRDGVQGKASEVAVELRKLESSGAVEDRGTEHRSQWHAVSAGNPQGTGQEPVRNRSGNRFSGEQGESGSPAEGGVRSTPSAGTAHQEPDDVQADLEQAIGGAQ